MMTVILSKRSLRIAVLVLLLLLLGSCTLIGYQALAGGLSLVGNNEDNAIDASVYTMGYLDNGQMFVTLDTGDGSGGGGTNGGGGGNGGGGQTGDGAGNTAGSDGNLTLTVGDSTLNCQVLDEYPDRLYCIGPAADAGVDVPVVLNDGSNGPLFSTNIDVPDAATVNGDGDLLDVDLDGDGQVDAGITVDPNVDLNGDGTGVSVDSNNTCLLGLLCLDANADADVDPSN